MELIAYPRPIVKKKVAGSKGLPDRNKHKKVVSLEEQFEWHREEPWKKSHISHEIINLETKVNYLAETHREKSRTSQRIVSAKREKFIAWPGQPHEKKVARSEKAGISNESKKNLVPVRDSWRKKSSPFPRIDQRRRKEEFIASLRYMKKKSQVLMSHSKDEGEISSLSRVNSWKRNLGF